MNVPGMVTHTKAPEQQVKSECGRAPASRRVPGGLAGRAGRPLPVTVFTNPKVLSVQTDNLLNKLGEYDQGERAFRMLCIGADCFVKVSENINWEKNENYSYLQAKYF